jgi:hypothetical protein
VRYSSLVKDLRGSSALLVLSWREALFLVVESILRKFVGFFP